MKTENFDEIIIKKPRNWNKVNKTQKSCIAFDTETLNGYMFLLSNNEHNYKTIKVNGLRIENNIIPNSFESTLEYLMQFDKTLNVFYNLSYDCDAINKHLPISCLKQLAHLGYTIYKGFYISGIPRKSIDIAYAYKIESIEKDSEGRYNIILSNGTEKNYKRKPYIYYDIDNKPYMLSKKIKFFDVWQFFKYEKSSSLDACSKKYLGAQKDDIEFYGYNKENLPLDNIIVAYCNKDCELTKRLTDIIINACNDIGLVFNTPYSCATISSDYFFTYEGLKNPIMFLYQYGKNINYKNLDIFRYAYYAYKGGRTEVCKRGYFEECYEYDVNSMYPFNMTKLYNIFSCTWVQVTNEQELLNLGLDNLAYAFLNCDIKMYDNYTNPLPFKHKGYYIYGYGDYKNYHISLPEYEMIKNLNLGKIKIKSGWVGIKTSDTKQDYVFKDIVERTYKKRNEFSKLDFRNALLKIILNSIYGRFIEVNINKELDDEIDLLNDNYTIMDTGIYKKMYLAGKYFCPIYACNITSLSRCYLYENIYANEPEQNFISSFTDSILSKEPLKNLKTGDNLGEWEFNKGELTIIGSGIYRLELDDSTKLRTRGIHIKESINEMFGFNSISLDDILLYGADQTKVKKLKESLIQNTPDEFNTFVKQHKTVNLNFDKKRNWNFNLDCIQDCYKECNSSMININELI